ncbi:ATP-dependent DNA helicase pif1, partial [Leucoagaricus sp. SymC.cos]
IQTGRSLRHLFVIILCYCNPSHPECLWEAWRHKISDDLRRQLSHIPCYQDRQFEDHQIYDYGLYLLNKILMDGNSRMFFIHSAGGYGKTYLCNTTAATVRAQGHIDLCVASSGIAALLLERGITAHSHFKIPIPVHEDSVAGITRQSKMYEVLCHTKVIIWDGVPMQHKHGILAVDKCLRDLLDKRDCPFGGITMVFGGDFRQTLPVVPQGSRQDIIDASLC